MEYGFQRVIAWQKAHEFVLLIYKISKHFPDEEWFGLTSELRRDAISIEANIAEGYKKLGKSDKLRFLNIAQGSLEECRDYHILAKDLNYINDDEYNKIKQAIIMTSKFLNAYCEGVIKNNAMQNDI